ncbi:MAG TPA: DoxX family protein [Cyclobacteriaceae bacterium]|nr:DoxX family protein [Cyclobacteriaceae bacterium]
MENTVSKPRLWTSYAMSGLVILFMLMDSIMKFVKPKEVIEGTLALGFGEEHLPVIGALGLISTLLYIIPRTTFLGAILLTGYFGGAIATHLRLNNPLFSHTLFTVYFGILIWGGLWLRNNKVRELLPLHKQN